MRASPSLAGLFAAALLGGSAPRAHGAQEAPRLVVGSKNFTESRLLGELFALLLEEHAGVEVEHRTGLGGTLVCHQALVHGELDLYPEYTGTAWSVVLARSERVTDPLRTFLEVAEDYRERFDVEWLGPLGFENAYALAIDSSVAERLGIERLSDLAQHASRLRAGMSIEFMNREDGYPGLCSYYGFELSDVRVIEHGLAYDAVASGEVALIDVYSTDGKLAQYDLRILEDDRRFFPPYHAAPVVRGATLRAHPALGEALERLTFRISREEMTALNHAVDVEKRDFRAVAREFLRGEGLLVSGGGAGALAGASPGSTPGATRGSASRLSGMELGRLVLEHLHLTFVAVLLATLLAVPLGIALARRVRARRVALALAGVLQTVPSLALLAVLIAVPGLGLSERSAVLALFLYALLPILRNTCTGLGEVDPDLIDAARGMGLTEAQVLFRIQLPLATRTIMAGVRTATVISVGVATLAAFIGAGGLGEPILTGLYLNDTRLILFGAVPAALLALLVDGALALVEARLVPRGLRVRGAGSEA